MSAIDDEIQICEEELRKADASSDVDTSAILDQFLAEDLLMVGPGGRLFTKAFLLEAHRPPKRQFFKEVKISERVFKDLGESTAQTCCRADYTQKDQSFALRFFRVWHKLKGQWKLVGGTVTPLTDQGEGLSGAPGSGR